MPWKLKSARKQNSNVQAVKAELFNSLSAIPKIAIALSGGGDSMALLRMLLEERAPASIIALTVDHRLRETSTAETVQVAAWCKHLGVNHVSLNWQHEKITSGIQAKARKARYDLMAAWCTENQVPVLLTAHTIDDQAETVAMRQSRTTSPKSLSAIWPETQWNGIRIVRPFLHHQRDDLRNYLKSIDQAWIDDPSNTDERFERIRIRNLKPDSKLAELATVSQEQIRVSAAEAKRWCDEHLKFDTLGIATLARIEFSSLSDLAKDSIIQKLCLNSTELAERQRLSRWIENVETGRRTLGGMIFALRKKTIVVAREPKRISPTPTNLAANTPIIWDQRFRITSEIASTVVAAIYVKPLLKNNNFSALAQESLPVVMANNKVLAVPFTLIHPAIKFELSFK